MKEIRNAGLGIRNLILILSLVLRGQASGRVGASEIKLDNSVGCPIEQIIIDQYIALLHLFSSMK
ncbi:MAG: hypothetical protein GF411_06055 [Candidatus Lokiarchaeota archaeon]|nr:hypothetical protein [Candidatus Lokiarchaeota archaeon]